MPLIRIVCPRWHSPKIRRAPVSPAFVRRWEQHVIFSRCIVVSSPTKKSDANCSVWTSVSSLLLQNCRESTHKKLRKHWPVKGHLKARAAASKESGCILGGNPMVWRAEPGKQKPRSCRAQELARSRAQEKQWL